MDALTIFLTGVGIYGATWLLGYMLDQKIDRKQAVANGANNDIDEED